MFQCSTLTINNGTFVAHVQVITKQKSMSELWELEIYGSWHITKGYSKPLLFCRENLQDRKYIINIKNVSFLVYLLLIKKLKLYVRCIWPEGAWETKSVPGYILPCRHCYTQVQKGILQQHTVHVAILERKKKQNLNCGIPCLIS